MHLLLNVNNEGPDTTQIEVEFAARKEDMLRFYNVGVGSWAVDVRLPGKWDSDSHGARPVHLISTMMQWFRTVGCEYRSLSLGGALRGARTFD